MKTENSISMVIADAASEPVANERGSSLIGKISHRRGPEMTCTSLKHDDQGICMATTQLCIGSPCPTFFLSAAFGTIKVN